VLQCCSQRTGFRLEVSGKRFKVEVKVEDKVEAKGRLIKIILRREVYHVWLESYNRLYVAGIVHCL
jgi:hypothetical protein